MGRHVEMLNNIGPDVNRNLGLNFTNPSSARAWDHEDGALKRCKVWRKSGVRYQSQWYFIQSITNDDLLRDFAEWDRMYGALHPVSCFLPCPCALARAVGRDWTRLFTAISLLTVKPPLLALLLILMQ